ncbi:replicative DNA helicase [Helicobacter sp.]|uniref:replicative DNA helicase n=1 Tax=Helicobacter sp. TaxID=218 RepID=UPI0025C14F9D|nr:replicative DNA helicase [Helicobacter sp.]MBR2495250.1 replicative DNA helicase [Helicobacter sp.]
MRHDDANAYLLNVERGLIAAFLFDEHIFTQVQDSLVVSDFLFAQHQKIIEICLELKLQDLPINAEFVASRIKDSKISEEDFAHIIATSPIANVVAYIKEIKTASIKRQLATLATKIASRTSDVSIESDVLLDEVEREIYAISSKSAHTEFQSVRSVIDSTLQEIEEMKERGFNDLVGVDTGFAELNKYTTGFRSGELIIIAARPAMGKTTLFLNMIQHTLNRGGAVAIFSLEMPATQLMFRMLSSLTSIPLQTLRQGKLDDGDWSKLTETTQMLLSKSLYIDDGSSLTIAQLRSKLRKLKAQVPSLQVAVVDYLQLMRGGGGRSDSARHEEVSEISRGLKTLARDLEIPIIALSQVSRAVDSRDDKRPQLSDLRESGSIEQDADVVLFLYREDVYAISTLRNNIEKIQNNPKDDQKDKDSLKKLQGKLEELRTKSVEPAEIIIAKNRNGETKTIRIQFNKPFIRFEDVANGARELSYEPTQAKIDVSTDVAPVQVVPI